VRCKEAGGAVDPCRHCVLLQFKLHDTTALHSHKTSRKLPTAESMRNESDEVRPQPPTPPSLDESIHRSEGGFFFTSHTLWTTKERHVYYRKEFRGRYLSGSFPLPKPAGEPISSRTSNRSFTDPFYLVPVG